MEHVVKVNWRRARDVLTRSRYGHLVPRVFSGDNVLAECM